MSYRRDSVTVPRIWITLALSVLIHALVMWRVHPNITTPSTDEKELRDGRSQLSVQLVPRRSPPPVPATPPAARRPPRERVAEAPRRPPPPPPPKATAKPAPKPPPVPPPVLAREQPAPSAPTVPAERPAPPRTPPPPARAPDQTDLASYVEARRRARGESPPTPPPAPASAPSTAQEEDPNARANRLAMANLGLDKKPTFGADKRRGGGVFTIQRMSYDYAEFLFFGWNKDIKRDTQQLIEVRKGNNSDIRIAVVRRMIAIIRDHEQGDFVWESPRLGRNVTLSARQRDNAGLEAFMLREFFDEDRR